VSTITTQATIMADRLRGRGERMISNQLNNDIARAFLLKHPEIAFDFNARLVTQLREQGIWPSRYTDPQDFETPAP
jgi:lambda repressor-like predicted transcriptional regulator